MLVLYALGRIFNIHKSEYFISDESRNNLLCIHISFYEKLLAVPRRLFCFGSLVILDVARCYLWLFTLYINIKIGKNSC